MNISQYVGESLRGWGGFPVVTEFCSGKTDRSVSSEELISLIDERASYFRDLGIGSGHLAALFLDNGVDFFVHFLALLSVGAIPVMVKMEYRRIELDEIFANSNPQIVISERHHTGILEPYLKGKLFILNDTTGISVATEPTELIRRDDIPSDLATINYTYRGLGYPVGAMTSHKQYLYGVMQLQSFVQVQYGETILVILPLSHIFSLIGCLLLPIFYRNRALIVTTLNPRKLFQTIRDENVQNIFAVPEIYELLYRTISKEQLPLPVKKFLSGGSRLSAEKHKAYEKKFGVQVIHGYGLTEFTPVTGHINGNARYGTIGVPGPLTETRIQNGELQVRSPAMTLGYYERTAESSNAFDGSWFKTGDQCHFDDDHLVFDNEIKQTRKVNGIMVDLTEVQKAISLFPDVDAVEIEFDDGQLTAHVSWSSEEKSEDFLTRLRRFLTQNIAQYKVPRLLKKEVRK